jgi:ATP synthase protein I
VGVTLKGSISQGFGGVGVTEPGKPEGERKDDGLADSARAIGQAAPYMDAVWRLVGGAGIGVGGGYFLDRWLNTSPWLLLAGSVVGLGLGMAGFLITVMRLGKKK